MHQARSARSLVLVSADEIDQEFEFCLAVALRLLRVKTRSALKAVGLMRCSVRQSVALRINRFPCERIPMGEFAASILSRFTTTSPYDGFDYRNYQLDLQGGGGREVMKQVFDALNPKLIVEVAPGKAAARASGPSS
jgi:hypothetical protein